MCKQCHILTILVPALLIIPWYFRKQEDGSNLTLGCKTSDYEHPYELDIDFEFYRSAHGELVGRQWLLYDLENKLIVSSRGVMMIAEMGYGKSAIMSHLVCQDDKRGAGYSIYQNISVFHICTFESRKTLLPGLFVKNMIGGFAKHIPKFKKHIEKNRRFKAYIEGDKCIEDPEGCLDFLIIKTFQELPSDASPHIVAIDALDECIENEGFNILSLLLKRISNFPNYIKFLISSRKISPISQISRHLTVYELMPESYKNKRDISLLVEKKWTLFQEEEVHRIQDTFKTSDIKEISNKVEGYAKGNMLFALHALKFWSGNKDLSLNGPLTLETLFYNQFYRIFEKDEEKFSLVRKILELLCASSEPLSEEDIFGIANISDAEQEEVIKIIGNELNHFVRQTNGKIVFLHKTLSDFLTKKGRRREKFYISKQNGCSQLSGHLLKKVHVQHGFKGIDIFLLTTYVSCSTNQKLKNIFLKYGIKYNSSIEYKMSSIHHRPIFLLHRASLMMNSYSSMSLFLDLYLKLPFTYVDEYDDGNITASYVAAAYGNHKTLLALLKYGADVNFTRLGPRIISSTFNNIVEFSKTYAQWQYNLLNIASQNGHLEIVRVLFRNKVNAIHKSVCRLNSFHLASEFGHLSVVKYFLMNHKREFRKSLNFSLYLASRNGHDEIVRILLYHGAVDACLPCSGRMYWTKFHQTRLQVIDNEFDFKTFNYVCMDDKRLIRCETAVEIAIQNGHTETVKRLIEHGTTSLQCREAGGRTPLLTAVRFDRTEILQYFMSLNVSFNQHCITAYQKRDDFDLSKAEEMEYDNNICVNDMSSFHMVAEYGSSKNLLIMYNKHRNAFWTERDTYGATPLHYLACRGRQELRSHFETEYYVKSYNGSTPLHSAAICKQYFLLSNLFQRISVPLFDYRNQSVVHYLARSESYKSENFKSIIINGKNIKKQVIQKIREELFLQDDKGRTAMHHAAINGNIKFLQLCLKIRWNQNVWSKLLSLPDFNNATILDLAFDNLPQINDFPAAIPSSTCLPSFSSFCRPTMLARMNPHQYFIYLILETSFTNDIFKTKISIYMKRCLQRGNILIFHAIWTKCFQREDSSYELAMSLQDCFNTLPTLDYIDPEYFSFIPLSAFITCRCNDSKTFTFHTLMEDPKGSFRLYLNNLLQENMNCTNMNFCYDDEGFNPLHRTVVSGNFLGFEFLLKTGMSVNIKTRDGRDILQLLVDYKSCIPKYLEIEKLLLFNLSSSSIRDVSRFLIAQGKMYNEIEEYIANNTTLITTRTSIQICDRESISLSFSHLVAAKGLMKILGAIKEKFGEKNSNCTNSLKISTSYILGILSHDPQYLLRPEGNFIEYQIVPTSALYLKFAYDFKTFVYPKGSALWKCKQRILNFKNTKALLSCVGKLEEELWLLMSQLCKLSGIKSKQDFTRMCQICKYDNVTSAKSDFDCLIKKLNIYWKNQKVFKYMHLKEYHTYEIEVKRLKCEMKSRENSELCLFIFAKMVNMKRWNRFVFRRESTLIPFLTITYLYEHEIMKPFSLYLSIELVSELSHKLIKNSMLYSLKNPGFQSSKEYAYWDVLRTPSDKRSKKAVQAILNSSISDIRKWKSTERSRLDFTDHLLRTNRDNVLPKDRPLHNYENLTDARL